MSNNNNDETNLEQGPIPAHFLPAKEESRINSEIRY